MKNKLTGKTSMVINAPASKVWEALTVPSIIKKYFFGTDTHTSWKPGAPITFTGEWEGKKYEDKGTVLNNEPNHLLKYSYWSSMSGKEDAPENYMDITYLLDESAGKTTLTVMQENIPDEKSKAHSEQNWKMVLEKLKKLLETTPENVA